MSRMATTGQSPGRAGRGDDPAAAGADQRPGVDKARADTDPELSAAVARATAELGDSGRVLLRPSGTESLVRVMVEAQTYEAANAVAEPAGRGRPVLASAALATHPSV